MKEKVDENIMEYPENPPWTMFFDGPLYQKYDEFMKTKDFSQILLNTKLMLANSHGPVVGSPAHSIGDDQWNKEYKADPTGNTYQYVSYDYHRRNKEEEKRRTRRTRAFILLGIVMMAAVTLGTVLIFHYFFTPPLEERNPINSVNVSFSGNTTSADLSGVEQTTQLDDNNDAILQILDELSDDGHPHDREHDQEHVLNPDGKIFDDIVTGTTMVHPTDDTLMPPTTVTPSMSTDAIIYELHLKPKFVEPDDDHIVTSDKDQSTTVTQEHVYTATTTVETVLGTNATDNQTYTPLVTAEQTKLYTVPMTTVTEDIDKQFTSTAITLTKRTYPQFSSTSTTASEENYPQYKPTTTTGGTYPQYISAKATEENDKTDTSTETTATEEEYPQYTSTTMKVTVGKSKPYTSTMVIDPMDFFGMDEYFTTTYSADLPGDLIATVDQFSTTEPSVSMSQSTPSAMSPTQGNTIEESSMPRDITSTKHATTQQTVGTTTAPNVLTTEILHKRTTVNIADIIQINPTAQKAQPITITLDLVVRPQPSVGASSAKVPSTTTIKQLAAESMHDITTVSASATHITTDGDKIVLAAQSPMPLPGPVDHLQTSVDTTTTDDHTATTITALTNGNVHDNVKDNVSSTVISKETSDSDAQSTTTTSAQIESIQTSVDTISTDADKATTTVKAISHATDGLTTIVISTDDNANVPEAQASTTTSNISVSFQTSVIATTTDTSIKTNSTMSAMSTNQNVDTFASITTEQGMTLPVTSEVMQETSTTNSSQNMVQMHDVTSYTFENAKIICRVLHAIRWQSLSIKINQEWRPLEVTLHPSGKIKWSNSKTKRHDVIYDIINSTDGTGSNMTLSLLIEDIQCGDANTYICTLESEILDQSTMSELVVVAKPSNKVKLTLGPSIIEDRALRITASWQGGYPIPWANMSWIAIDVNNKSYNLADYGEYRDYELHEDHRLCQTTLKHSIVVFPKKHLNHTTVIVKPNPAAKRYFVDKSMEHYLHEVQPGIDKILVIPLDYCQNGKKDMSIPHPYTPCTKFVRCLPGDLVVQLCPRGTCFSERRQQCA